jgi:hypothetical protein
MTRRFHASMKGFGLRQRKHSLTIAAIQFVDAS